MFSFGINRPKWAIKSLQKRQKSPQARNPAPSMITPINSEDRLVQQTFADHLHNVLGWESIYAFDRETFEPHGTSGRADCEMMLKRDLRVAGINAKSTSQPIWHG
tara:strand:- start:380 stop:694 length:315 start_codon:yes stop_codon:yes gene_type:complete